MDEKFVVKNFDAVPNTIYYIPNFITPEEEEYLMTNVESAPKPKWTILSNRRLQNWGGLPHPKGMLSEPLPKWLQTYADKLANLELFDGNAPNHVLVNEYLSGQGIMPHEDGPLFHPTVTTINLGSHTVLNFYKKPIIGSNDAAESTNEQRERVFGLLLEPRSLLVLKHHAYDSYLHGIEQVKCDTITEDIVNLSFCNANIGECRERETRISLTIRFVPKVLKNKLFDFCKFK